MDRKQVDAVLVAAGERLFYPRAVRAKLAQDLKFPTPQGGSASGSVSGASPAGGGNVTASGVRRRIQALVQGVPQVVVRITSKPTGMRNLRDRMRYATERGEVLHDEQGREHQGPDAVRRLATEWCHAGTPIPQRGTRAEALHITLDMPEGTNPEKVQAAAAAFAAREFRGHKYAWAFHGHQQHPHVHLLVRVEGVEPQQQELRRLDPRKADLARWRQTFAHELQARGIEAEATSRVAHGGVKNREPIWIARGKAAGKPVPAHPLAGRVTIQQKSLERALQTWGEIHAALLASPLSDDRTLAQQVRAFVERMPMVEHLAGLQRQREQVQRHQQPTVQVPQQNQGPDIER